MPKHQSSSTEKTGGHGSFCLCVQNLTNSPIICHLTRFLLDLLAREYVRVFSLLFFILSPLSSKMIDRIHLSLYSKLGSK